MRYLSAKLAFKAAYTLWIKGLLAAFLCHVNRPHKVFTDFDVVLFPDMSCDDWNILILSQHRVNLIGGQAEGQLRANLPTAFPRDVILVAKLLISETSVPGLPYLNVPFFISTLQLVLPPLPCEKFAFRWEQVINCLDLLRKPCNIVAAIFKSDNHTVIPKYLMQCLSEFGREAFKKAIQ